MDSAFVSDSKTSQGTPINRLILIFRVELAVWTHSVANDFKPELLKDMPDLDKHTIGGTNGTTNTHNNPASENSITTTTTSSVVEPSDESNPAESAGENNENNHNKSNENEQKEITKQKTANGEWKMRLSK